MYSEDLKKFKEQFLELIPFARQMKKQIITFQDGRILGTDETCASLSIVYYDDEKYDLFKIDSFKGLSLTFFLNELTAYLKVNDIRDPKYNINQFGIFQIYGFLHLEHQYKYAIEMMNMDMRCRCYMSESNHTIKEYQLREDQNFNSILEMKKKNGASIYDLDNRYLMSTFSTIHPVTKSDNIIVDIFESFEKTDFLSRFLITKKNCIIEEFIRYRML